MAAEPLSTRWEVSGDGGKWVEFDGPTSQQLEAAHRQGNGEVVFQVVFHWYIAHQISSFCIACSSFYIALASDTQNEQRRGKAYSVDAIGLKQTNLETGYVREVRRLTGVDSSPWSCGACTYSNSASNQKCEMCRSNRPTASESGGQKACKTCYIRDGTPRPAALGFDSCCKLCAMGQGCSCCATPVVATNAPSEPVAPAAYDPALAAQTAFCKTCYIRDEVPRPAALGFDSCCKLCAMGDGCDCAPPLKSDQLTGHTGSTPSPPVADCSVGLDLSGYVAPPAAKVLAAQDAFAAADSNDGVSDAKVGRKPCMVSIISIYVYCYVTDALSIFFWCLRLRRLRRKQMPLRRTLLQPRLPRIRLERKVL